MTRKNVFLTAFLMGFAAPALGQIIIPPTVVWVGPEDECDFTSIQEWLDQPPCPFCPPPLGGLQLRLSDNYQHSGNFEINSSVSIIGGFPSCGAPHNGTQKLLQSTAPGALIVLKGPESNPIRVTLGSLILIGSNSQSTIGGVLELQGGAELELQNTRVSSGRAQQGGGVGMHGDNNRFTMTFDSLISGNIATQDGGGIYCQGDSLIDFQEGAISGNSATIRGGGIALFDCDLTGSALNQTRRIADNAVTRDQDPEQPGKGGGIYARGANTRVELGGILTRTRIEDNEVARWTEEFPFIDGPPAHGGGLHAQQGASVILRNVEFFGNVAPSGAGLSFETGASIDIDRTSGPCLAGRASECSSFIGNKAEGWPPCDNGNGAAIFGRSGGEVNVRRTTFRDNISEYFDECSIGQDSVFGSLFSVRDGTSLSLEQNLVFLNAIEDKDSNSYFILFALNPVSFTGNTVVFNSDAEDLFFLLSIEAVGNILWEPEVDHLSRDNEPVDLSACNVLDKNLPAVVDLANTQDDPGFVDVSSADFHLAPGSPAINRCDDRDGRLTAGFDIEGRARPSSDGGNPLLGNYDSGAFEFHSQSPDEVDLLINLVETSDPDESGATFEARLTNVGLTTAAFGNFNVRFVKPAGGYEEVGGNWSCAEQNVGGTIEVECATFISSGLATSITTVPLVVEVNPDPADGTCTMDMRADSGSQPDTVPDNDARTLTVIDCDADGVVPDEIFDDRFEAP